MDRGFHYGDGLFETCRLLTTGAPLWAWHQERLRIGCERLAIPFDAARLDRYKRQLIQAGQCQGLLKVILTRGIGGRGYGPPEGAEPNYHLMLYPYLSREANQQGVVVRICHQRLSTNPALAGIKHLNRLEQILARAEWKDDTFAEGLLLDEQGQLIEAVSNNLFLVMDGALVTPDLSRCGVAGVMRRLVIERLAPALQRDLVVRPLTLEDLEDAEEVFLCNSVNGIWPVLRVEAERPLIFPYGQVTRALQQKVVVYLSGGAAL